MGKTQTKKQTQPQPNLPAKKHGKKSGRGRDNYDQNGNLVKCVK